MAKKKFAISKLTVAMLKSIEGVTFTHKYNTILTRP